MDDVVDLTPSDKHDRSDGAVPPHAGGYSSSSSQPPEGQVCMLIYPPPPAKGGIAINSEDFACLAPDEFLNDVIIDFYLKYLMLTLLKEEEQTSTHLFSSFFYKRLTSKPPPTRCPSQEGAPLLSPAEKRHMRVRSWTKNVNIFQKKFILIPINKNVHWFLAIICFPGLTGPVSMIDDSPLEVDIEETKPKKSGKLTTIVLDSVECLSDRDEADSDDDDTCDEASDDEASTDTVPGRHVLLPKVRTTEFGRVLQSSTVRDKLYTQPIKQPCILIFDSLRGASNHGRVVATLRDYLQVEYRLKEGKERVFSRHTMRGACPRVPQQNNFTDCGLYVLQYAEAFFKEPLGDYRFPIRSLRNWFPENVVRRKREDIRQLLTRLMKESSAELRLPSTSASLGSAEHKQVVGNPEVLVLKKKHQPQELLVRTVGSNTTTSRSELLLYRPLISRHTTSRERIIPIQLVDRPRDALYRLSVDYNSDGDEDDSRGDDGVVAAGPESSRRQTLDLLRAKRIDRHLSHDHHASPSAAKKCRNNTGRVFSS